MASTPSFSRSTIANGMGRSSVPSWHVSSRATGTGRHPRECAALADPSLGDAGTRAPNGRAPVLPLPERKKPPDAS